MARQKLDAIDRQILVELQNDGRMTNVELAQRVKITAPPCLRRVRALEKAGYIKGYHADLDAAALGFPVTAYAFVGLSSQAESDLKAFEEEVRSWPEVRSCYMLSGEVDFILRCVAHDLPEFQAFITEKLTAAKNVASVKTAVAIRRSKREPGIPLEVSPARPAGGSDAHPRTP
jgi:DNA-binding Lrp family transcriptional regulator